MHEHHFLQMFNSNQRLTITIIFTITITIHININSTINITYSQLKATAPVTNNLVLSTEKEIYLTEKNE